MLDMPCSVPLLHGLQRAALPCLAAFALNAPAADRPTAHQHGIAALSVAVDGDRLELELDGPLDSLLGFERAPRDARETDAVRALAATLRSGRTWRPTPAAQCRLESVRLASDALPAALLGEPEAASRRAPADDHADLLASYRWRCAAPAALKDLDVQLFAAFPRLRRLDVQIVGPRGQSAVVLQPGRSRVELVR